MKNGALVLAALLVSSVACSKKSGETPRDAGEKKPAIARPVASGSLEHLRDASAVHADPPRIEPGTTRPLTAEERDALTRYATAMTRGRNASAKKSYDAARAAFSEALVARAGDALALVERGEAARLAGDLGSALADLDAAAARADDDALRARALLALGRAHEARLETELARLAFARAAVLAPAQASADKMITERLAASRCPALVEVRTLEGGGSHGEAFLAKDFREVYAKLYALPPGELAPRTEADAKRLVCRTASADGADPVDTHPCDGPPPWRVSTVHDTYRDTTAILMPADGSSLVVVLLGGVGGAGCTGEAPFDESSVDTRLEKLTLVVTERHQRFAWRRSAKDPAAPPSANETVSCVEGLRAERTTFYDAVAHRIVAVEPFAPEVTVAKEGRVVRVTGAGCDESVPLASVPSQKFVGRPTNFDSGP